ncbi:MAG TPA: hypothetical protein VFK34_07705 [Marmoricola sp.]|jgi:hypothetical protein|nr:hypothetical protein [Marmoricola sp.]
MNLVSGLSLARIGIGGMALAAPELTAKAFRLDATRNRQLPYMMRMFGSRELALGALTLMAPRGARKALVVLGMGVDAADAFAGQTAAQSGAVSQQDGMFLSAPAVAAVAAGALGLLERRKSGD